MEKSNLDSFGFNGSQLAKMKKSKYGCIVLLSRPFKGSRMDPSVKVSLWCVTLLINTRFRFFILE